VVVLYSEVNESETDDIMTRFPKMHKKNDKQSFLSMNFYLREGEEIFFSLSNTKMQRLHAIVLNQESNSMLNYSENDPNIQKPIVKIYLFV
jgi:hypothetical protein